MKQLKMGTKIEMEHKGTIKKVIELCKKGKCPTVVDVSKMIAKNHLSEDPKYYSKLKKANL